MSVQFSFFRKFGLYCKPLYILIHLYHDITYLMHRSLFERIVAYEMIGLITLKSLEHKLDYLEHKCPICFSIWYIHAVYTPFQPKTITAQCMRLSIGSV